MSAQNVSSKRPRILIINPNMTEIVTTRIVTMARREAGDRVEIVGTTASFGASYISSRISYAIAGYAALDLAARSLLGPEPPDAIIIGCFGDPGVGALRELTGLPIIGFAESGILEAAAKPGTFSIVTNGDAWCDMLRELVGQMGLSDRVAAIASLGGAVETPEATVAFIEDLAAKTGASRCVLGGAGLIPLIEQVAGKTRHPLIDPHRRAVHRAIAAVQDTGRGAKITNVGAIQFSGLTPALATLLGRASST